MGSVHDDNVYPVEARVPADEWRRAREHVRLLGLREEWAPDAAGPEVALRFLQGALSEQAAEGRARNRLEAAGLRVFAVKPDTGERRAAA